MLKKLHFKKHHQPALQGAAMDTLTVTPKTAKKTVQFNDTLTVSKGSKLGKKHKSEGTLRPSSKGSPAANPIVTDKNDGNKPDNDKRQKGLTTDNRHLVQVSCADSAYSSMSSLASPLVNRDRISSSSTVSSNNLQIPSPLSNTNLSDSTSSATYNLGFPKSPEHLRSNSFEETTIRCTRRSKTGFDTCTKSDLETLRISRQLSPKSKFKNHRSSIKLTLTEPMRRRADSISFSPSYDSDCSLNQRQKKMLRLVRISKDSNQGFGFSITTIGLRDKDGNMRHRTFVTDVDSLGPAKRCGLFPGDEILAINGVDTDEINHYEIIKQVKYSKIATSSNMCTVKVAFVDGLRYVELHMKCNKKLQKLFKKQEELRVLKLQEKDVLKAIEMASPENIKSSQELEDSSSYLNMLCTSVAAVFPTAIDNTGNSDHTAT
ncbi:General receptor for phosphoinositides 1-associated scaffold protein [Trichoplax sp. H2]|nr:General receptor for phosphoinositides 1-associated scaffold protein [Trichoplax sp. H2]|eukprot:RDD40664.1 General receptor for phosphoinositides 1-associated scaffold protein [Trichoplax sp. H2]